MTINKTSIRRIATDAAFGLAVYMVLAIGLLGAPSLDGGSWGTNAHAGQAVRVEAFTGPMAETGSNVTFSLQSQLLTPGVASAPTPAQMGTLVGLGAVFAALFAFNLAFFRHLRRVYVAPRRRRDGWSVNRSGA